MPRYNIPYLVIALWVLLYCPANNFATASESSKNNTLELKLNRYTSGGNGIRFSVSCSTIKESDVYNIGLNAIDRIAGFDIFYAYCLADPNGGAGWTVIQRRLNGRTDFYRIWYEYANGFGDPYLEYWIGLERLHTITKAQPMELWVEMRDFRGKVRSAYYSHFVIGSEGTNYKLESLGEYSGDAGDSLRFHEGQAFTTKDRDNDKMPDGNCAVVYSGAWWYNNCLDSNLNGLYGSHHYGKGITWKTFIGDYDSAFFARMAIRPSSSRKLIV